MSVEKSQSTSRLSALKNAPQFVVDGVNQRRLDSGLDPLPSHYGRPVDWAGFGEAQRIANARWLAKQALAEARRGR